MSLRFGLAQGVSSVLTWGLKGVFHRPAANTPGKIALYVDPQLIEHLRPRLREGSIAVVGTNGKTTVTNMLADSLERAGKRVVCNRTGANLDSGVSTALLQCRGADWGVFESDELWLAKILPQLRANYVVLLNLFRDQLDRCGEIDRIQDSIVGALGSSPDTVLVYNADDPLCAMIAERASQLPGREGTPSVAFGVKEDMGLAQNVVADATMCQRCSSMFEYEFRQYGQLGAYRCPRCGFERPRLDWEAHEVQLGAREVRFALREAGADGQAQVVKAAFSGAYMVYNLMAVSVAARLAGCSFEAIQQAVSAFDPKNGRLQEYAVDGRRVLLNLAKNPTGFNQNLKIVAQDDGPKAVAFFINDKEADGHDISWIWDIDFEELVVQQNCVVYAGGIRKNDLQVRLKYAGVEAHLIEGIDEVFAALPSIRELPGDAAVYAIANYTALPGVKAGLDALAASEGAPAGVDAVGGGADAGAAAGSGAAEGAADAPAADEARGKGDVAMGQRANEPAAGAAGEPGVADAHARSEAGSSGARTCSEVGSADARTCSEAGSSDARTCSETGSADAVVIAHMFPDLLNLYGDGGNVRALAQRLHWRGIPVEVRCVRHGQSVDLQEVDLVFLGGGPDREQRLASEELMRMRDDLARFVKSDGALLAICGGYQILGSVWLLGDEEVPGLELVDVQTRRPGTSADRLIDNIVLRSSVAKSPVVGYENHAGRTYVGEGAQCFGQVVSSTGCGNNDSDKADGVLCRGVVGTYLHGPLLPKNPEVADYLLGYALRHHAARTGREAYELAPLDDSIELAANAYMCKRLGVQA